MQLFHFFRDVLAWSMLVAALGAVAAFLLIPLKTSWGAIAYRIRHGPKPLSEEQEDELFVRGFWGSLSLLVLTAAAILLDFMLASWFEFPPGIAHLLVFMGYAAAAAWLCTLMFGYSDLLEGLGVFVIYIFFPALVLWLLNLVIHVLDGPLNYVYEWLLMPT